VVHELVDAVHQGMAESVAYRLLAPGQVLDDHFAFLRLELLGDLQQAFGGIGAAIEHYILDAFAQLLGHVVIDHQCAGIDDAHIHAGLDGVVQEDRVDRLAHGVVAAERERHIRHATGHMGIGETALDLARGLDEIHRIVVVFIDAGGDGKDVRVEDDVFRREVQPCGEQLVGARADFHLAFAGIGLALFVEGHHHHGGAVLLHLAGVFQEHVLAFLHGDGVDDALALQAAQAGFDHAPFGGVDHHRYAGDVRLGGDQIQIARHRCLRIDQALVHVDVDDLCTAGNLLACHIHRFLVAFFLDELAELR
jgi:hypothetical protein